MKNSDYNFFINKLASVIISLCGFSTIYNDKSIYIQYACTHTHTHTVTTWLSSSVLAVVLGNPQ